MSLAKKVIESQQSRVGEGSNLLERIRVKILEFDEGNSKDFKTLYSTKSSKEEIELSSRWESLLNWVHTGRWS